MKKEQKNTDKKSRCYTFTINNYTQKDLKKFHKLAESLEEHRYICYGLEMAPKTGTKHIQGYLQLNNAQRFNYLHKYFNFTRKKKILKFHIEIANGTAKQNKKYCSKEGDFFEFGEPTAQGARADIDELKTMVRESGMKPREIIDTKATNLQHIRLIEKVSALYLPQRSPSNPPKVYWIYGTSGIGKTKLVFDTFDDVCAVSMYRWLGTNYEQNECFLLDDFRHDSLKFEEVLKIADRYPYTLEYKGSQIPLNSPYIVFTSPYSIEDTFTNQIEDLKQLHRRMIQIHLNKILETKTLEEIDLRNYKDEQRQIDEPEF